MRTPSAGSIDIATYYQRVSQTCMMIITPYHQPPQTLFFHDAETNQPIHLVGTMHYNPHSIKKVEEVIKAYGSTDRLGSLVIESCEERWEITQRIQPMGSKLRSFPDNEFQAAAELADQYGARIILADENISRNNERVNSALIQTVQDLGSPPKGWERIIFDLRRGWLENIDP